MLLIVTFYQPVLYCMYCTLICCLWHITTLPVSPVFMDWVNWKIIALHWSELNWTELICADMHNLFEHRSTPSTIQSEIKRIRYDVINKWRLIWHRRLRSIACYIFWHKNALQSHSFSKCETINIWHSKACSLEVGIYIFLY